MDTARCAEVARESPELIRGIKVRIGADTGGVNGIAPLYCAIEAADRAELPVKLVDRYRACGQGRKRPVRCGVSASAKRTRSIKAQQLTMLSSEVVAGDRGSAARQR